MLSDQEAQRVHVQNETAAHRALAARGLTELLPIDRAEGGTDRGAASLIVHPELGRVIVTSPRTDHVVAVDPSGVAHEVALVTHYVRTAREHVQHCDPRTTTGGGAGPARPPIDDAGNVPAPAPIRRYYKLAEGQQLGAAIRLGVEYVKLEPVYVTGHLCNEIP
jgi:hypothetical protein